MLPLMLLASALFGMAWAAVPAYLQAYRGSHVVITTIMFNFIASSVLVYLLVNHLRPPGQCRWKARRLQRRPSCQACMQAFGLAGYRVAGVASEHECVPGLAGAVWCLPVSCGAPALVTACVPWAPARVPRLRRHQPRTR
jgi:ABC-type uncharacterized transport system permease subunit